MKDRTILLLFGVVLFLVLGILVTVVSLESKAKDEACEDIGFKKYVGKNNQDHCEDVDGNLYYMKMITIGNIFKYKANPITVGNIPISDGGRT